jgi:hypothetical protein
MWNFLVTLLGVILADRAVALVVWAYGKLRFHISLSRFYRVYGWISFPRTFFGACACIPDLAAMFVPIDERIRAISLLAFYCLFGFTAVIDAMKANRADDTFA